MLAEKIYSSCILTSEKIGRIEYTADYSTGTGLLSNKAQRCLWFFLACLRLGYIEIHVPIGALRSAIARQFRFSERTLYRALAELEQHAIIWRRKNRVGHYRFETKIILNESAFAYWLKKSGKTVKNYPTSTYKDSQLPNWQIDDLTKNDVPKLTNTYSKQRPARARDDIFIGSHFQKNAKTKTKKKKRPNLPPLLFTLAAILNPRRFWPDGKHDEIPNGKAMFRVAKCEYDRPGSTDCAVDFVYWAKNWEEMSIERREITARAEILPYLQNSKIKKIKPKAKMSKNAQRDCDDLIAVICGSSNVPISDDPARPIDDPARPIDDPARPIDDPAQTINHLSNDEMEILMAANKRARLRSID